MHSFRFTSVLAGIALALSLTSCASTNKTVRAAPGDKVVLDKTQYEEVYVTGSNIPILVPKGDTTAKALPTISPVQTVSSEAFTNAMRRAPAPGGRR